MLYSENLEFARTLLAVVSKIDQVYFRVKVDST